MATYGDMQARIADEMLTTAITTAQIQNAIQDAIRKYERRRFWFNERRWDMQVLFDSTGGALTDSGGDFLRSSPLFTTIPGVEFYDQTVSPEMAQAAHLDKLVLVQSSINRYTLTSRTPQWMDDNAVGLTWRAMPTDWSFQQEQVRLFPIPDAAYPILAQGTQRFNTLVNSSDTNPWMVEAEELIRSCAEAILARRVDRDMQAAQIFAQDEAQALASIKRETTSRGAPSGIRISSYF